MFVHPSYILDLVPVYISSLWRCANGAGVLRVPMANAVPVYLMTDISVRDVK